MAALNFPNSPSTNDLHTENGVTFKWNGTIWKKVGPAYTDTTNLNVTGIGTFAGAVNIAGVLTYEDVKNVDSVGIITARSGISVTGGSLDINQKIKHIGDLDTFLEFSTDEISFETGGSERMKVFNTGVSLSTTLSPATNNTYDLGSSSYRWANLYINDLQLSNEGSSNSVDGTWGDWTLQEGEEDIFMLNNRSGKKYKMNLTEVS